MHDAVRDTALPYGTVFRGGDAATVSTTRSTRGCLAAYGCRRVTRTACVVSLRHLRHKFR